MDFPPFPGFRPEAFAFLKELKQNNRRDWFKPRKTVFEDEIQWPMKCLVADCSRRAHAAGLPLLGDPDRALFRIYRDTRFSKDKNPYKTAAGAVLSRTGGRDDVGAVYIHVEPKNAFLATGFWQPDNDFVRLWRAHMVQDPDAFREMLDALQASGLALETEAPLKRLPKGYEPFAEHPFADYLKWKSFVVTRRVTDEAMQSPAFAESVFLMMRESLPLLEFGWETASLQSQ